MTDVATLSAEALYEGLTRLGSDLPAVGGALLNSVEIVPGHEETYLRWYEDDHFISGAMAWPWVFSGRRWVSTRELNVQRLPADSTLVGPRGSISFFHTYLIVDGHVGDVQDFMYHSLARLREEGRLAEDVERRHVYSYFSELIGAAYAPDCEPRAQHALQYPFRSLALEVVDATSPEKRDELGRWLAEEHAPEVFARGPAMCLVFAPRRRPDDSADSSFAPRRSLPPYRAERLTVVWLSDQEPAELVPAALAAEVDEVAASGRGHVVLLQPFLPALAGTKTYLDQLI